MQGIFSIKYNIYYYFRVIEIFKYFREILASPDLLNIQDRIDWKKCSQSEADEVTDVQMFSKAFASFNPFKDKNQS